MAGTDVELHKLTIVKLTNDDDARRTRAMQKKKSLDYASRLRGGVCVALMCEDGGDEEQFWLAKLVQRSEHNSECVYRGEERPYTGQDVVDVVWYNRIKTVDAGWVYKPLTDRDTVSVDTIIIPSNVSDDGKGIPVDPYGSAKYPRILLPTAAIASILSAGD